MESLIIIPNEKNIIDPLRRLSLFSPEFAPYTFLRSVLRPYLRRIVLKGIPEIKRLYPVEAPVWLSVRSAKPKWTEEQIQTQQDLVKRDELYREWVLYYNYSRMEISGVTSTKLARLVRAVGMEVLEEVPNEYMVVRMPAPSKEFIEAEQKKAGLYTREGRVYGKPAEWVNWRITNDTKEKKEVEMKKKTERKAGEQIYMRPTSEIELSSKFYYADTDGSNLEALLGRLDIDVTRTISNNVHDVYRTLGIEAARTFLINAFVETIRRAGQEINVRHIVLLVDFMTNIGEPTPITFSGISRQPIGALEKATFERAMDTFRDTAVMGRTERIPGVHQGRLLRDKER